MEKLKIDLLPEGCDDLSKISKEIIRIYGAIQDKFPDVYVNGRDGKRFFNDSGYRLPESMTGASKSAHKQGLAIDLHRNSKGENAELYDWIIQNGAALGVKRIEDRRCTIDCSRGTGWVHIDLMEGNKSRPNQWKNGVYVFVP